MRFFGISRALAVALAERGKSVLIIGLHEKCLAKTAQLSPQIDYFCVDVSLSEGHFQLKKHLKSVPTIHGLIHNAGTIDPIAPVAELDEVSWRTCMTTHVDTPLFLTQLLADKLLHGRVLNISSGTAHFPVAGWAAYCVSKAALSMLTRCWQIESTVINKRT